MNEKYLKISVKEQLSIKEKLKNYIKKINLMNNQLDLKIKKSRNENSRLQNLKWDLVFWSCVTCPVLTTIYLIFRGV